MQFLPSWLNPFDVLIIFALLVGVAIGFARGLIRMALSLLVLYIAAVLATAFYAPVGGWFYFAGILPASRSVSEAVSFLAILILAALILNFVSNRTYRDTEWPGIRQIDQLGGLIIGFLLAAVWIGLCLIGLAFVLGTPTAGAEALRRNILAYFHASNLIPTFYDFLPIALAAIKPWMPKGLPPDIFTFRL